MSVNPANANSANSGNFRKRQAILCGVSDYSILMGSPLPTVEQEISAIDEALSNKLHEGYRYKVTCLLNEKVTDDLSTIFAPYTQDSPTDELLFYFSGHGTIYNGEPYFVTHGAASNNPGIKLSDLATQVSSLHPGIKEIFLILDFCHSGGISQAIDLDSINPFVSQTISQRTAILTATRKHQLGETKNQFGKSFADYFIEALTNTLPDKNGHISFGRLALYISEQMQSSYVQSPVFYAHALSGHPINKVNKKILLPHRRNPFFTGRVEALSSIETALSNNNSAVITQAQAISGMGGIGKTQTAIEFCYRQITNNSYQTYQTILWVNAENEISFNNSYYDIVDLLNLAGNSSASDGANHAASNAVLKVDEVIVLVKRWLANNSNWLIVLDNLEDPKLIKHYLPPQPKGHVLITTRSQSLKGFASIVPLKKMSLETGTLFLLKRANLIPIDTNNLEQLNADNDFDDKLGNKLIDKLIAEAQKIVQAMDGLPLALEQAGAYIQESECSLADYLKSYEDVRNTANILDNAGEDANDHKSVYTTFKLNFDVVKEKSVAAAKLLEVCSFLDSELIPEEIFTQAGNFLDDELAKLQDNTYEFNNCLKLLLGYSLIERDTDNKSLSIHKVVQTVLRHLIAEDNKKSLVDSLAKALDSLSNDDLEDPKHWPTYQKLLASVTNFSDFAKLYQSNTVEAANLFNQFGVYSSNQALFVQSLNFHNLALDIYKHHFGDKHPSVAMILNNVGLVHDSQGNYPLALDFLNQALNIRKQHFGDFHPDVAGIFNNIGKIHQEQGNYPAALDFYNQALSITKQYFGDFHLDIANPLNNIGSVYYFQGNHPLALDFLNQALNIRKQHSGNSHPSVADSLNNISLVYQEQGNYSLALDFYNQALNIKKQHFGNNHPSFAATLNNIGETYRQQGNYSLALTYFNQSLSTYKYHFGYFHPSIAMPLLGIASIHQALGNYSEALDFYNQAFDIYKQHFGDNHPSVATTLNNVGLVYYSQGNYSLALDFYYQALDIYKQHFGDNHHHVAMTLNNIGTVYQEQSNYPLALDFLNQSLTIYKHLFGDNHLSVTNPLNNIGQVYYQQGNYPLALDFLNQSLSIKRHLFGDNHPSIADSLNNIANVYEEQGNYPLALDFYNQSLSIKKQHFRDNHPSIADSLNNIGLIYKEQSNYPLALDFLNQALDIYKQHFGDNHPSVATTLNNIGLIYKEQSNYPLALDFYNQSLSIKKHHFGDNHPSVADSLNNIAAIYNSQGNHSEALDFYKQSLSIKKHYFGDNHSSVALTLANIAMLYETTNKGPEAASHYQQAIEIFDKFLPANHPHIIQLLFQYIQLLLKLNRTDEVQPLLDRLTSLK